MKERHEVLKIEMHTTKIDEDKEEIVKTMTDAIQYIYTVSTIYDSARRDQAQTQKKS